jgi:hypothetical protein
MPVWTTELSNAETAEQSYRATRKGALPGYWRFDGRGAALISQWIQDRSSVSSAFPRSNGSAWLNIAARAVTNMGASWSVVSALSGGPAGWIYYEKGTPFGFVGSFDGLFDGLISPWTTAVWTAAGGTVPAAQFPPQEYWSNLLGHVLQSAGPT